MLRKAWRRDTRAVAAVEFALAAPVMFMLVASTVDFGLLNLARTRLTQAVEAGGGYAQQQGTAATSSGIQSYVQNVANLANVSATATAPACYCITGSSTSPTLTSTTCGSTCPDGTSTSAHFMTISASYTYTPLMPFWDSIVGSTPTVTTTVQLP